MKELKAVLKGVFDAVYHVVAVAGYSTCIGFGFSLGAMVAIQWMAG